MDYTHRTHPGGKLLIVRLALGLVVCCVLFVLLPVSPVEAGCCACGGFGNAGSYLIDDVTTCDACTDRAEKEFYTDCRIREFYDQSFAGTESADCCVMRQKIGGQVSDCWTNYPYAYCVKPKEFSTVLPEWKEQACSAVTECKDKIHNYIELVLPAAPEDTDKLVYFIPQVTIPLSDKFNRGEKVVLTGNTLGEYIGAVYIFGVAVAGILATIMIMYGGLRYVTSFGNPQRMSAAKDTIVSAMIGLALALGSYTIFLTINPNILKFTGLSDKISKIPAFQQSQYEVGEGSLDQPSVVWDGKNPGQYDTLLTAAANKYGVRRDYLKAIMLVESSGNPNATSKDKEGKDLACGLMQLLPSTAARYSSGITCQDLKNPTRNIDLGARYFRDLLDATCPQSAKYKSGRKAECHPEATNCRDGVEHYAIAAYNGGPGANCSSISCPGLTWWECDQNPGFKETRNYVLKVEAVYQKILTDPAFAWQD